MTKSIKWIIISLSIAITVFLLVMVFIEAGIFTGIMISILLLNQVYSQVKENDIKKERESIFKNQIIISEALEKILKEGKKE